MALFTAETAAIAGIKGAMARWHAPKPEPIEPSITEKMANELADKITRVSDKCINEIEELIDDGKAQQAASLARCLRDLRETWHMATGHPKPGMTRPVEVRLRPAQPAPTITLPPVDPPSPGGFGGQVPPTNSVPPTPDKPAS